MVSQIKDLLLKLNQKEGQLRSKARGGAITPDLRKQIKSYKNDLTQLFQTTGNGQVLVLKDRKLSEYSDTQTDSILEVDRLKYAAG